MDNAKIVGHSELVQSISQSITDDSFSHAMILTGQTGYGALPIALATAQQLLCKGLSPQKPCLQCESCKKAEKLIHPDLHFAFPVVRKEGKARKDITSSDYLEQWREAVTENPYLNLRDWLVRISSSSSQGDINVAECNQIIHRLGLKSFGGAGKVQIIWMAEYLGANANRLLKLIEEPPPNTYIILICENLDLLIVTVQSRCRIIRIPKISLVDIVDYLRADHGLNDARAQQVALLADGDLDKALGTIHQSTKELLPISLQWLDACHKGDIIGMKSWVESFDSYGLEEKKSLVQFTIRFIRETMRKQFLPQGYIKLSNKEIQEVNTRSYLKNLSLGQVEKINSLLSEGLNLLERNANTKILFFNNSLKIEAILTTS